MSPGNNRFRSIESCQQMELVHLSTHCVPFCSKSFQTKQRFGFLYMKCPSRDRAHWCRWAYIVKIRPSWWHECVFWQLRYLHESLYRGYSKVGSHKIADWWLMECPCATLLSIHLYSFFFNTVATGLLDIDSSKISCTSLCFKSDTKKGRHKLSSKSAGIATSEVGEWNRWFPFFRWEKGSIEWAPIGKDYKWYISGIFPANWVIIYHRSHLGNNRNSYWT